MNVPQKCSIGVRWLATAHTYPFLLIYLSRLSLRRFWSYVGGSTAALSCILEGHFFPLEKLSLRDAN